MIDEIDHQILELLQQDARLSNAAIAEQVGLTTSAVYDRVKKLEKKGIIKGYVALVDAAAIGKPILAFIRLSMRATSTDYLTAKNWLIDLCLNESSIQEFHTVAGEDCYLLKVRVANPNALEDLIEQIRTHMTSKSVTNIVLTTVKESTVIVPHRTEPE